MTSAEAFDAVLLTGGRARRFGGADKSALVLGGRSLGQRVVAAVAGAGRLVIVGPSPAGLDRDAVVVNEDPPGGGPAAAIAEGLRHVRADVVVVLAVDQPFVTPEAIGGLRAAIEEGAGGALAVDGEGRDQPLCSAWRTAVLAAALAAAGDPVGLPVRRVVDAAGPIVRLGHLGAEGDPPPWFDCDTPADLTRAEGWL